MPSTYAHYRLGQEVRNKVGDRERAVIETYPGLFLIGLHGPDILFYYKPLTANRVNQIGYSTHDRPGEEFFANGARVLEKHKGHKAYLAYLYGFICHFALDATCHGYIDQKIAESGISHTEIEVEFDRELMIIDGHDPVRHKLTRHIVPSDRNAEVIKDFFKGVTALQVKKSLNGMIFNNNLLISPSRIKRQFVYSILKISGNYNEMHGLLVNYRKNPKCNDSTEKLFELYEKAEKLAVRLINEYRGFLYGKLPLNEIYRYTFGSKLPEKEEKAG